MIAVNLSSLYLQMWDTDAAIRPTRSRGIRRVKERLITPPLLLQLGRLNAMSSDPRAEGYFREGIESANEQSDIATEARGWDLFGEERLSRGDLSGADEALSQAYRLRVLHDRPESGFSYGRLGALKLAEGDLKSAGQLTRLSLGAAAAGKPSPPVYLLEHQSGQVLSAAGEVRPALAKFSIALDAMDGWRGEVLPATSSLVSTNIALERQVFRSFVETGARYALDHASTQWASKTFEALEANRAASLREGLALTDIRRENLPPEYWEYLAQLRNEETRQLRTGMKSQAVDDLHLKLTEMEAQAGLHSLPKNAENFRSQSSLSHFQAGLSSSELFLSFHLGSGGSFLWAVGRDSMHLYSLPCSEQIALTVREFLHAVRQGQSDAPALGQHLYAELLGD